MVGEDGVTRLKTNLATDNFPTDVGGCFLLEVTTHIGGGCNDAQSEIVLLQRK